MTSSALSFVSMQPQHARRCQFPAKQPRCYYLVKPTKPLAARRLASSSIIGSTTQSIFSKRCDPVAAAIGAHCAEHSSKAEPNTASVNKSEAHRALLSSTDVMFNLCQRPFGTEKGRVVSPASLWACVLTWHIVRNGKPVNICFDCYTLYP